MRKRVTEGESRGNISMTRIVIVRAARLVVLRVVWVVRVEKILEEKKVEFAL